MNGEGLAEVRAERDRLKEALFACAKLSGADVSDGPPGWPDIATWAIEEVGQARKDCDEDADEDRALRARVAELEAALRTIKGPADSGPWIGFYRDAGGGYEGLQAIAREALDGDKR